jgi:hypothetical protein
MKISEDVIIDLLPLYFSRESSADTRLLIDDYCLSHPDFAKTMQTMQSRVLLDLPTATADDGTEAVGRVKRQLRWRGLLQAFAILCTLSPFSFSFSDGRVTWFMLRDAPATSLAYAVAALAAWFAFAMFNRRMNKSL